MSIYAAVIPHLIHEKLLAAATTLLLDLGYTLVLIPFIILEKSSESSAQNEVEARVIGITESAEPASKLKDGERREKQFIENGCRFLLLI